MKLYSAQLKHDDGIVRLKVWADSEEQAKQILMEVEKCPERAIETITEEVK